MQIKVAGENALIIYFGNSCNAALSRQVQQGVVILRDHPDLPLIDLIPSYASILVVFDPIKMSHHQARQQIRSVLENATFVGEPKGKLVGLPVYYGEDAAPDLLALAEYTGLSTEQIIRLHQQVEYQVYAIGFAPGFAFLGELDKALAMPRRARPRRQVPKGSVAIADRKTAVYPAQSPGGWNLIGRCPVELFDLKENPAMPFQVGDRVRFNAISRSEYLALGGTFDECID